MYIIEEEPYGARLTLRAVISVEEMGRWLEESRAVVPTLGPAFCVFVDMRDMEALKPDAKGVICEGQEYYLASGMRRSVVIVNSPKLAMQFKRIACETGIHDWERDISADQTLDWEQAGLAWLRYGTEPDHSACLSCSGDSRDLSRAGVSWAGGQCG